MLDNRLAFQWPRAGDCFDKEYMRLEHKSDAGVVGKVHLGLFPALIHTVEEGVCQDHSEERIVLPAVVMLQ